MSGRQDLAIVLLLVLLVATGTAVLYALVLLRAKRKRMFMSSRMQQNSPHWIFGVQAKLDAWKRRYDPLDRRRSRQRRRPR